MSGKIQPWYKVYSGDDECRFFKVLCRHPKFPWRTVKSIAKNAKLTIERTEEIAEKYVISGQVLQSSKDPSKFAYFQRVDTKPKKDSISKENKKKRVKDTAKATSNP